MNKDKIKGSFILVVLSVFLTFIACWYFMDFQRRDVIKLGEKMIVIKECVSVLKTANYPLEDNDAYPSAINGYISSVTSDDFTYYKSGQFDEVKEMTKYVNTSGTALASGFQIDISEEGNILIKEVTPGLTAAEQGIKSGDIVTAIDGVLVSEKKYENIANKLLGKKGTIVNLTIKRDNSEFDLSFVRDHFYVNTVEYDIKQNVGLLCIKSIDQYAGGQFDQSVNALANCNKIIIDLRNNLGGEGPVGMAWAARICGNANVKKTYYDGKTEELFADGKNEFKDKKIVILVNENTASAAEIMCANIAQNMDVKIVGVTTYGKGVFQECAKLRDGGELWYVAGSFTVGDWECWQGKGIEPDVEITMAPALIGTDDDVQLKKAFEILD